MSYFPFFVELSGKQGLIVGGGRVALGKAEKLLAFGPRLTVVAPEVLPELAACPGLFVLRRPFRPEDLEGMDFVIAAADPATNREAARLCRERNIPVNVVDDRAACTFLFPALVKRGRLTVGISTGGASPTAAVHVKEGVEELLPEKLEGILDFLEQLRPALKEAVPTPQRRAALHAALFRRCLEVSGPLNDWQLGEVLEELGEERGG